MTLREAVANLIKVKGRHNTEIAYQKLIEAFDADNPREWQGLTDEEIDQVAASFGYGYIDVARAIESKLKGKNT